MGNIGISKNSRHIRYYSEPSDDFEMDYRMGKHHIVFVNDPKGIRRQLNSLIENMNHFGSGNIEKRLEGKVKNSNLNFLFVTIETPLSINILKLENLEIPLRKDTELYERKKTKIEDYVSRLYQD
jgi:hypothetical protein